MRKNKNEIMKMRISYNKTISVIVAFAIAATCLTMYLWENNAVSCADIINLPLDKPLPLVSPIISQRSFHLPVMRGIEIDPNDFFKVKFYFDTMDKARVTKKEANRFVRYFLGFLAIPASDLWVNLSPYEKDMIIPEALSKLDIGKDFLLEDYLLKQLITTLTNPNTKEGKAYWDQVYKVADRIAGVKNVDIDVFYKVWIMPDHAKIYLNNNKAFIKDAYLKVMMEEDYYAMKKNKNSIRGGHACTRRGRMTTQINQQVKKIFRKQLLPIIQEQVNNSRDFAPLRQLFHVLILANYFKDLLRQHPVYGAYIDRKKTDILALAEPNLVKDTIYQSYVWRVNHGSNVVQHKYNPQIKKKGLSPLYFRWSTCRK